MKEENDIVVNLEIKYFSLFYSFRIKICFFEMLLKI